MARPTGIAHVAMVAAILALSIIVWTPAASAAPTPPTCQVTLDQRVVTASPTRTTSVTLAFTGAIDVSMGSFPGSRVLSIVTEISPGSWAASVSPASENVTGVEKIFFNATVGVPAASLASATGTLTVRASFDPVPGASVTCSDQSTINVAAYYGVDADALTPRLSLVAGRDGIMATVLVHNLGNTADYFNIELENKADVDPVGLLTNLPRSVLIQPDAETNVSFIINATSVAEANTYELFVLARSQGQPASARDVVTVTAVVTRADIIPQTDPTMIVMIALALGGVLGVAIAVRTVKRRKAAREAMRQLARIMRAKKAELGAGDAAGALPGEVPPEPAPSEESADGPLRVRVKVPPKA